MTDPTKPLSDNEIDDLFKAWLDALDDASGKTVHGETALKTARDALTMLSLGLIKAGLRKPGSSLPE